MLIFVLRVKPINIENAKVGISFLGKFIQHLLISVHSSTVYYPKQLTVISFKFKSILHRICPCHG